MAIIGLILGLLGVVTLPFTCSACALGAPALTFLPWIFGIVGIILSTVGLVQNKKAGTSAGVAIAGLVLSVIATALGLTLWFVCGGALFACGIGTGFIGT